MNNPEIDECGNKCWYNDRGELHREDGPAIEWNDGDKWWYINSRIVGISWQGFTQEDFERYLRELKIKEYW